MGKQIGIYGSGTIGSCEATLIIGHGIPCTVIGHSEPAPSALAKQP